MVARPRFCVCGNGTQQHFSSSVPQTREFFPPQQELEVGGKIFIFLTILGFLAYAFYATPFSLPRKHQGIYFILLET